MFLWFSQVAIEQISFADNYLRVLKLNIQLRSQISSNVWNVNYIKY